MQRTILVVDDEESIRQSLSGILMDEGFEVLTAGSGGEAIRLAEDEMPNLILLDIWLPGMDGIEALKCIKSEFPAIPVIMMSGHGTIETAVKATKLGAFDFIEKPLSLEKMILIINHALDMLRLEEENKLLKQKLTHDYELTGDSPPIQELKETISIVAPTNAWILIMGENGTGKELVARAIHRNSKRVHKPFVEVNCAAIPEELIESELFGHEKGAFTGATAKKRGKFDLAHGRHHFPGRSGRHEPEGSGQNPENPARENIRESRWQPLDYYGCSGHCCNKQRPGKRDGRRQIRQDLYYRLNVIPLKIPPLRERKEDISLLVKRFLLEFSMKEGEIEKTITDMRFHCSWSITGPAMLGN